jgi:hypothetical protein
MGFLGRLRSSPQSERGGTGAEAPVHVWSGAEPCNESSRTMTATSALSRRPPMTNPG